MVAVTCFALPGEFIARCIEPSIIFLTTTYISYYSILKCKWSILFSYYFSLTHIFHLLSKFLLILLIRSIRVSYGQSDMLRFDHKKLSYRCHVYLLTLLSHFRLRNNGIYIPIYDFFHDDDYSYTSPSIYNSTTALA